MHAIPLLIYHEIYEIPDADLKIISEVPRNLSYVNLLRPNGGAFTQTNPIMKLNVALLMSIFGFAFTMSGAMAADPAVAPAVKEAPADASFAAYSALSTALYKDDLEGAKKAAATAAKQETGDLAKHYQGIADSTTLDEARNHFKEVNDIAIPLAKGKMTMHEMRCPMAMGGKGAHWLQSSPDEVQNPYMGSKMPHCGAVVK